jgi:thermitase
MRKRISGLVLISLILAVIAVAMPFMASSSVAKGTAEAAYAPDRVIVKFAPGLPPTLIHQIAASHGATVARDITPLGVKVLRVPKGHVLDTVAALSKNPNVIYAEPAFAVHGTLDPNDPYYASRQYGPQIIQANLAWDITQGSSSIVVAVVDSGVDPNHPDLAGKLLPGYDFANNDSDPSDDNGHGTHVAGIVGALTNNGVGTASIGFNTRILPVKVLNAYNSGYWDWVANGIVYAVNHGAHIINLSLGGTTPSSVLQDAVNYAWSRGALIVAAAGNNGNDVPFYPAAYDVVMGVAATDYNDARWGLSNYGSFVSVSAPGASVYSTYWDSGTSTYRYMSGTSMAAPHVSGVAALLLAQDAGRSNAELRTIIESTADDLGDPGWDPYFGHGRVNAYRAVTYQGSGGDPQPPAPTPTPTSELPTSTPTPTPEPPTPTPTSKPPTVTTTPTPEPPTPTPTPVPNEPSIRVKDIVMSYKARKGTYQVKTEVYVVDDLGKAVRGVAVTVDTRLPDGSTVLKTANTDKKGKAKFTVRSSQRGTYVSIVVDMVKAGYVYNPATNAETSESLTVP